MQTSERWDTWYTYIDERTCEACKSFHGKVFERDFFIWPRPPVHWFCRCEIVAMAAMTAGEATWEGLNGADYWLRFYGRLPDYYVDKKAAKSAGWKSKRGNLGDVLPGVMIGGEIYANHDERLPDAPGRSWYEADINYRADYRSPERILYSNDGLIFITLDHYGEFIEII
ncbi:MAG: phage head morphogenesis protein [Ruminococcaceae bacterium]|nr:phage head morphogenesis protein [Oscillospiraceae bacterium]